MLSDLRDAVRAFKRGGLSTVVTVATLAIGIGAVTALFAIVDAVLLAPVAADQDRLVRVWKVDTARGGSRFQIAYVEYRAWRDQTRSFVSLAAMLYADAGRAALTVDGQPLPVSFTPVSPNFFTTLFDAPPLLGRWLDARDDGPGGEVPVVISEGLWRRAIKSDPAIVGRSFTFNGDRSFRVVGVAPESVQYPLMTEIWVPIGGYYDGRNGRFDANANRAWLFELVGRLDAGVSAAQASAELQVLHRQLAAQFPDDYSVMDVRMQPLVHAMVGNSRQVLWFLFAAAGLVFAIAGVNVAALLLMRSAQRRSELAMRIALGASAARLIRQAAVEAIVLAILASTAGLLVASLLMNGAQILSAHDVPRIQHAAINARVLLFCSLASVGWVLVLGMSPVWAYRRLEVAGMWTRSVSALHSSLGLRVFLVAEIAAAVIVTIAATLLVRSFAQLQGIDRGYDRDNLAVMSLMLPASHYPDPPSRLAGYERLFAALREIPGVISSTSVHMRPGSGDVGLSAPMRFEGQTEEEAGRNQWATWEPAPPAFFETLGITIIRGRPISEHDTAQSAPVVVVSEAMASRYWPGQDPIGKRLKITKSAGWSTVVGVARDMRYRELTKAWLTAYFPARQFFFFAPDTLVVRTAGPPDVFSPQIQQAIRATVPVAAIDDVTTMREQSERELSRPRTALAVAALFAFVAIVLAAVGVYAVVAYDVRQRRKEFAVRAALGARAARISGDVTRQSLGLAIVGLLAGLGGAFIGTRALTTLLYQVDPVDPWAFATGAIALLAIVGMASYPAARRAAMSDPAAVLRD
jgi:putative ABC transport system permease protein